MTATFGLIDSLKTAILIKMLKFSKPSQITKRRNPRSSTSINTAEAFVQIAEKQTK